MGHAEILDLEQIAPIIERARVCRMGFCRGDVPYVVPMNFGYRDGCVYLHSSPVGRKMDLLRENPYVCFEVDLDHEIVESEAACAWGMRFRSVICSGKATLLEDPEAKIRGLDAIMDHYSSSGRYQYSEEQLAAVAVIKVELLETSARVHGYEETC